MPKPFATTTKDYELLNANNSTMRLQRNIAEKQRRDKLSSHIQELASVVPIIPKTSKRLDKTSILRLTAAYLRLHFSPLNHKRNARIYSFYPDQLKTSLSSLEEITEGFLLIANTSGKIMFISSSVEKYLGYMDVDMIGHSLFYFIHRTDAPSVQKAITNLQLACSTSSTKDSRAIFTARIRQNTKLRADIYSYQTVRFSCYLNLEATETPITFNKRRKINVHDPECTALIKIFIQPINLSPRPHLCLTEAFQDEYITTHGLNGEIISVDHRISSITGYLPSEVHGMSAYQYIFSSDVPIVLFAQKLMFSSNNGTGVIVYRLRTRNANFIYLQSTGHVQYNDSSSNISHFICINKLLSNSEGSAKLQELQVRFMPSIKDSSVTYSSHANDQGHFTLAQDQPTPAQDQSTLAQKSHFTCIADQPHKNFGTESTVSPNQNTDNAFLSCHVLNHFEMKAQVHNNEITDSSCNSNYLSAHSLHGNDTYSRKQIISNTRSYDNDVLKVMKSNSINRGGFPKTMYFPLD